MIQNEFFTTEYTHVLQSLIKEIVNDPTTYRGAKYLPSESVASDEIYNEIIEATGGVTNEHVPGTDPKYVQRFGNRVEVFSPPKYKEVIMYDEKDILYLRKLGQNDRSQRGIRQYINESIDQLNRRIEARIELERWNAIFDGEFSYMGKTFSYAIPAGNRALPIDQQWSDDGVSANDDATPIQDIRYWLMGGLGPFRKYTVTEMVMNPNTARWLLDNKTVREWVTAYGANNNLPEFDINKVLQFMIPGCPPATIYNGWYQEQTVVNNKITVGNAIFFIPDGYIYFVTSLPGGDEMGKFQQGIHLADGTIDQPGMGKFLAVEECIASGTRGGPKNPFVEIIGGVYGGVNLKRAFDVLTGYVGPAL